MIRSARVATMVGVLVMTLGLGVTKASAASIQYDFNVSNGFTGAGSAPFGRLTLTEFAANDILVIVELFNGLRFVSAFDATIGFNLVGIGQVTFSGVPVGWTVPNEVGVGTGVQNAGAYGMDGFGNYEFGLEAPGSGGSSPQNAPISFHVKAPGITLGSFVELSSTPPGAARYFAADVIGTGAGAGTGAIGITGTGVVVPNCLTPPCTREITEAPEPATLLLLGTGLALAAMRLRRRAS